MAENIKTLRGRYGTTDLMTIPQLKSAKKILTQKLEQTRDPLLKNKLQSRINEFTNKERAINKYYEKCARSTNPHISSMIRGKRFLLTFVDVKRNSKGASSNNLGVNFKKQKADYNGADFLKDIGASNLAFGAGVGLIGFGALDAIKFTPKGASEKTSILKFLLQELGKWIAGNKLAFGFLLGGAALIAASKNIPAISRKIRRIQNHASYIRATENEISDELYKDESGFDHTALSAKDFPNNKEKIVNDLFNHPNLLDYYKSELRNPNSKLTASQKMNLYAAIKEVNYKLDDYERLKSGRPTKAEETEIKKQQELDEQNYNQAKTGLAEVKQSLVELNNDTPLKSINELDAKIKKIETTISEIKDKDLKEELTTVLQEAQTEYKTKSAEAIRYKDERDSKMLVEIENDIKSITELVDKADSKTPLSELTDLGNRLSSIQAKIDGMEIAIHKSKAQNKFNAVNEKFKKIAPQTQTNQNGQNGNGQNGNGQNGNGQNGNGDSVTQEENDKIENEIQTDESIKSQLLSEIEILEKKVKSLTSKSEPGEYEIIDDGIDSLGAGLDLIKDEKAKIEVGQKLSDLITNYEAKKHEIESHKESSNTNKVSAETIKSKLAEFEGTIPEITAEGFKQAETTLEGIYNEISTIKDSGIKTEVTNVYNAVKGKLQERGEKLKDEIAIVNANNELDEIDKLIEGMSLGNYISISERIEAIEPKVYNTRNADLARKFVDIGNKYITKRNQLKGQTHDKLLDVINQEMSEIRQKIAKMTFENFDELKAEIDPAIQSLEEKIEIVPTTKAHFTTRLDYLKKDYQLAYDTAKEKQATKQTNNGFHRELDALDPKLTNIGQKLLSIPDFKKEYEALLGKYNELRTRIKSLNSDQTKHVENRLEKCVEQLKELYEEYSKIEAENKKVKEFIDEEIKSLKSEYNSVNFSDKASCDAYKDHLIAVKKEIAKIHKDPDLVVALNDELSILTRAFHVRLTPEDKEKTEVDNSKFVEKIYYLREEIQNGTVFDEATVANYTKQLDEIKEAIKDKTCIFIEGMLNNTYATLEQKANEYNKALAENELPDLVAAINKEFETLYKSISSYKSESDLANIEKTIKSIQENISNLKSGQNVYYARIEDAREYLTKKKAQVHQKDMIENINQHLDKMDSIISKLNLYNFEQHTATMDEKLNEVNLLIGEHKIVDNRVISRFKGIQERYAEKHKEVEAVVKENNKRNLEVKVVIDQKIAEANKLIDGLTVENYAKNEKQIQTLISDVGNLVFKEISGNKTLKTSLLAEFDKLTQKFESKSAEMKSKISEENVRSQNLANLTNRITEIETSINALTNPSAEDIQLVQNSISELATWQSHSDIESQKITEAAVRLQSMLDSKKGLVRSQENLSETVTNNEKLVANIISKYSEIEASYNALTDDAIYKEMLSNNAHSISADKVKDAINNYNNKTLEGAKSILPPDKYNELKAKTEALRKNYSQRLSGLKARAIQETDKIKLIEDINKSISDLSAVKVIKSEETFTNSEKRLNNLKERANKLNDPTVNSKLQEYENLISQRRQEFNQRQTNPPRQTTPTPRPPKENSVALYEQMFRDATKDVIDCKGYSNAEAQTHSAYMSALSKLREYYQQKYHFTAVEMEKYFDKNTGEYLGFTTDSVEGPEFQAMLKEYKKAKETHEKVSAKKESTEKSVLEGNINNTRKNLVNQIAKILEIAPSEADKLVDQNGNLSGRAVNDSRVLSSPYVINLKNKYANLTKTYNQYMSSSNKGSMSPEVTKVALDELKRIHRNMSGKLGKEQADAIMSKICQEQGIKFEDLQKVITNHSLSVENLQIPDEVVENAKKVELTESVEPVAPVVDENAQDVVYSDIDTPKPTEISSEDKQKLEALYVEHLKNINDKSKKVAFDKEYNAKVKIYGGELMGTFKDSLVEKYKDQFIEKVETTKITLAEIQSNVDKQLSELKDLKKTAESKTIEQKANDIKGYLKTFENQKIEGFEAYSQSVSAEIDKIMAAQVERTTPAQATTIENSGGGLQDVRHEELATRIADIKEFIQLYQTEKLMGSMEGMLECQKAIKENARYINDNYRNVKELEELQSSPLYIEIMQVGKKPAQKQNQTMLSTYDDYVKEINKQLAEFRKAKAANSPDVSTLGELIRETIKELDKKFPEAKTKFAFRKEEIYREIALDEKTSGSGVKTLNDALQDVNTNSPGFKKFLENYQKLYASIKTSEYNAKKFDEMLAQITKDNYAHLSNNKELAVASRLLEIAKSAAKKAYKANSASSKEVIESATEKENVIKLHKEGLDDKLIEKLTGVHITRIKEILDEMKKKGNSKGAKAVEQAGPSMS